MKVHTLYLISILFFTTLGQSALCQVAKLDDNIKIGSSRESLVYSQQINFISVFSVKDSIQNFVIKSSQGRLWNMDSGINNGLLHLDSLKNGRVVISVFLKTAAGLVLRNYKTFSVATKPLTADEIKIKNLRVKPEITLEGLKPGKVSLHDIKHAKRFSINKPYTIKSLHIYYGSYNGFCPQPFLATLDSENFDESFTNICQRMRVGSYINLEIITITDAQGNIYKMPPIQFYIDKE